MNCCSSALSFALRCERADVSRSIEESIFADRGVLGMFLWLRELILLQVPELRQFNWFVDKL